MFVATDLALALVLLIGAGLMIKGLGRLIAREQNLRPGSLLTMRINLAVAKYGEPRQQVEFYRKLLEGLFVLPGVSSAAVANAIPRSGTNTAIRSFQSESANARGESGICEFESVSPSYLRTMLIRLKRGRDFTNADTETSSLVAIVSERMAQRFWPGQDVLGRHVRLGDDHSHGPWMTIVGVATDVVHNSFDREPRFTLYVPFAQLAMPDMHVVVRTPGDASASIVAVEAQVQRLDREQPVYQVTTLGGLIRDQVQGLQYLAILMSIFGGFALILASIGVYGVMAYAVSERTREIGVRVALGAGKRDVMKLVLRHSLLITASGVATGLAAAFVLARVLASLIFGVSSTDAAIFAGAPIVLGFVAMAASYLPARGAMQVDPIATLRHE
jgi:putative ABC transport system permease protein